MSKLGAEEWPITFQHTHILADTLHFLCGHKGLRIVCVCKVDVMMLESSRERGWDYSLVSRCLETERGLAELHTGHPLIPASATHNALVTDENCM